MKIKNNIIAFLIISILGTTGHFLYEWSNQNSFIGLFFPVNESIWEHLKLIFYPNLIYAVIYCIKTKKKPDNLISATSFSIFAGMFYTVIMYYTAKGVIGKDVELINISIFYIAIIITLFKRNHIINQEKYTSKNVKAIAWGLLFLMGFLFAVWSKIPPELGIFKLPS